MYCPNCGTEHNDDVRFCSACGTSMKMEEQNPQKNEAGDKNNVVLNNGKITELKYVKSLAITNIAIGAVLFLLSLGSEDDWALAPFALGAGICATGILQLLKKRLKIIAILQIIMGALSVLVSLGLSYDWEYIGFVAGAGMLTLGILNILNKPLKIVSIVEIVFGGVSVLLGMVCIDWAWGDTGLFVGASFLVEGILNIKHVQKNEMNG